jgi:hypothetical protein
LLKKLRRFFKVSSLLLRSFIRILCLDKNFLRRYIFFYQSAGTLTKAVVLVSKQPTAKNKLQPQKSKIDHRWHQQPLLHQLTKQDQVTATMFQPESFLSLGKQLMLRAKVVVLATRPVW